MVIAMNEPYIPVDILAFGAHPDDVEMGCGGLLALAQSRGARTAIIDCTRGEMASRGTAEERDVESAAAAAILRVTARRNLNLGDGRLMDTLENRDIIAAEIRRFTPKLLLIPYAGDRHPDHDAAGRMIQAAVFYARMKNRILIDQETGTELAAHAPDLSLVFPMHEMERPTLVVDVSAVHGQKMEAVKAFRSQFYTDMPADYKFIGTHDYIRMMEARGVYYGSMIQADYGEPYICRTPLKIGDPLTQLLGML